VAELAVLVPSRARPGNAARLLDAMEQTCTADTKLVLGLDADDPYLDDYWQLDCEQVVKPNLHHKLVEWLNVMAHERSESLIGHVGDDNVPRTVGWDEQVHESLERNEFCFGNDLDPGRPPGSLSIHIFMRRTVVDRLGYMGPPQIQHMYVDPVWYAWGNATSIEYLDDAVLEHMHYSLGRSERDESYNFSTGLIPRDCRAYNDYCDNDMNGDINKLGGTPYTPEAMAEFNAALNIPRAL
jgi:hypothetical protein